MHIQKPPSDVSSAQTATKYAPEILDQKLRCRVCRQIFDSRQAYDNHWLACHEDTSASMGSGTMGGMNAPSGEHCK